MAVIVTPNASSVKIKYDKGVGVNGERTYKTKTYSSIKCTATAEDVYAVVNAIVGLQKHTLEAVNKIDNSSLSE